MEWKKGGTDAERGKPINNKQLRRGGGRLRRPFLLEIYMEKKGKP